MFFRRIVLACFLMMVFALMMACKSRTPNITPPITPPSPPIVDEEPPSATPNEYVYLLFFNNLVEDPEMLDCTSVYPTERYFFEELDPTALIQVLIEGPTEEEKIKGFVSNFPPDTLLNEVVIKEGTAWVDFSYLQIGGSCATSALRSQITQTLLQFPEVNEVIITILGQTEGVLEP